MKLKTLELRNFRNIEHALAEFDPQINFFVGKNGQGKTSILEAVGYLLTLRSFRGASVDEMVHERHPAALAVAQFEEADWQAQVQVSLDKSLGRSIQVNGKPVKSSQGYLRQRFGQAEIGFHAVVFNPGDHALIQGEPGLRRSYLDRVLAAQDPGYAALASRHQKALTQRNALLRMIQENNSPALKSQLHDFTATWIPLAARLAFSRLGWLLEAQKSVNSTQNSIAHKPIHLGLYYTSSWVPEIEGLCRNNKGLRDPNFSGQGGLPSIELLERALNNRMAQMHAAELASGTTLVGPNRDDWFMELGTQNLKGHGSQGEVRTALLALKWTELELFRKHSGHRPLLLVDDFSSELDEERRKFLLKFLEQTDLQVLVTTTEERMVFGKLFQVESGRILK